MPFIIMRGLMNLVRIKWLTSLEELNDEGSLQPDLYLSYKFYLLCQWLNRNLYFLVLLSGKKICFLNSET